MPHLVQEISHTLTVLTYIQLHFPHPIQCKDSIQPLNNPGHSFNQDKREHLIPSSFQRTPLQQSETDKKKKKKKKVCLTSGRKEKFYLRFLSFC